MVSRWVFGVLVCAVLGCGLGCESSDGGGARSSSSATPAPAKRSGPLWQLSETELPIKSALAIGAADQQAWMFRISTAEQSCPSPSTEFPGPACPDKSSCLELWYAPSVKPGAIWEFVNAYVARGDQRRGGRVTAELFDTVDEQDGTVTLRKLDMRLTDEQEMSIEGDVVATKCPRLPRAAKPLEEPPKLSLSVSGTKLEVRGALVIHRDAHPILRLSTAPIACLVPSREGIDVLVDLALVDDGSKLRFASLGAARVRGDPVSSGAKDDISVTLEGDMEGEGSVTFKLEGKHSVQGHELEVSGTVVAMKCVSG